MGKVSPIKERQIIEKMKEYLREQSFRNYLLFRLGINLGLTIENLLQLQVEDLVGKTEFRSDGYRIQIHDSLQKELAFYIGNRQAGLLFRTPKGQPLSRFQLYQIMKEAAEKANYSEPIGALTLRKTFVYWAYKEQWTSLLLLSKWLGHHTINQTRRYINEKDTERDILVRTGDL